MLDGWIRKRSMGDNAYLTSATVTDEDELESRDSLLLSRHCEGCVCCSNRKELMREGKEEEGRKAKKYFYLFFPLALLFFFFKECSGTDRWWELGNVRH